jgi:hypothetical protein
MCRVPLRELFPENAMIGANLRVSSSDTFRELSCRTRATQPVSFIIQIKNSFLVPRININLIGIRFQSWRNPGLDQSFYTKNLLLENFLDLDEGHTGSRGSL